MPSHPSSGEAAVGSPGDLLALTAELVDHPSVSHEEAAFASWIEAALEAIDGLEVTRVGDNVVARTSLDRPQRVILAGHLDTVPSSGEAHGRARIDGDTLWGLGAADMKSGLAVMLALAKTITQPAVDVTYVFYAREEVAAVHNGLGELFRDRPDLLRADLAIIGEPTEAVMEAGCQGTMRFEVTLAGARAHTARPWMGRNAIHRLGRVLAVVEQFVEREPVLSGCIYREALQAVFVEGGVANNVVPDRAKVVINHRFAPDRSPQEAEAAVRAVLAPVLEPEDELRVTDMAPAAAPNVEHPLLAGLIAEHRLTVRAKLGWTDVARFASHGIAAINFGPGDPLLAHRTDERVERAAIERVYAVLASMLGATEPVA